MGNDKMTDKSRYWIWLSLGLGYSSPKPKYLYNLYDDIRTLYDGGEAELVLSGVLTPQEVNRLLRTPLSKADEIISQAEKLNQKIIDISESEYPSVLRDIENPPAVLYVSGNLPDVDNINTVSVIGTRKATVYGIRTAFELGANLSKAGFVVVSGGALGIDCAAHRGVLQSDGVTICVLGCGIDYDYLRENKAMRQQITHKGALVSEYPPGTSSAPRNFPQRNRIISALCRGLVVVEAPKASGSMITVGFALSQSKDVFAVMGNVDSPYSEGSNALIKDGAIPVTSYKDVAEYYLGVSDTEDSSLSFEDEVLSQVPTKLRSHKDSTRTDNKPVPVHNSSADLSDDERKVYYLIGSDPVHVDTIAEKSGMPVHKVLRIISSLEIGDLIINTEGRYYIIK